MRKLFLAPLALLAAAAPAHADPVQGGDVIVRLRGIMVAPNEASTGIAPAFPNEKVKVGNDIMPEVDVTYMATPNIGFELIAATTKHRISGTTGTTGSIGRLGSAWALPPTLTVQYHPVADGPARPYVGAGINYTIFYSENASDKLEAAVGKTRVRLGDSVGWAAQAGLDVDIGPNLFLNFDVKYIDIDTKARLATTAAGTQRVRVRLDPLVVGFGIGTRF